MSGRWRLLWTRGQIVIRSGLAGLLLVQALALGFLEPHAFVRLGYSDRARWTLAAAESVAAILTLIPRTFFVGAVGLIAVLGWAAGFHFALRQRAPQLFLDIALIAGLLAARSADAHERAR